MYNKNSIVHPTTIARSHATARTALSVLEFVGCLMALVGGIWLGAIYLGVDVRHIAYVALNESDMIDKVPEGWRPDVPESEKTPSPAELAASVQNELAALRHEITSLRDTQQAEADVAVPPLETTTAAIADATARAKQASLDYWSRLYDVVDRQATLQVDAESAATEGNATKVAALKGRISRFSASAIRALPTTDVDATAAKLGQELANWYENGANLYDQAVQVWESPARGKAGDQLIQDWEKTQVQHQNEGRLMTERATAVRDSLTRRFGAGFAPLPKL